jgi:hypothetical protein
VSWSLGADEQVVPVSEAKQLRARVRELERLFGQDRQTQISATLATGTGCG